MSASTRPSDAGRTSLGPLLVLALAIASVARVASIAGLVASALGAWLALELAWRTRSGRAVRAELATRGGRVALGILGLVAGVELARRLPVIAASEGLEELAPRLHDRLALSGDPAIAPPIFALDRPQSFVVRTSGERVEARFGAAAVEVTQLGHGVVRLDVDPRRLDARTLERLAVSGGALDVTLTIDGAEHHRALRVAPRLAHPRRVHAGPDGAYCVTSEETDELGVGVGEELRRVATLDGPTDCAFVPDGVLVAHRYAPTLAHCDRAGAHCAPSVELGRGAVALAGPIDVSRAAESPTAEHPAHADVVVALDGATRSLVQIAAGARTARRSTLALEGSPRELVRLDAGRVALTTIAPSALLVIALATPDAPLHVLATRPLAMPATALAGRGDRLVLATPFFDDDARPTLGNHLVEDVLVELDARSLAVVAVQPTARRTARQDHAGDVDSHLGPSALALADDGALAVAYGGSHEVALAPRRASEALEGREAVLDLAGEEDALVVPSGVAWLSDGEVLVTSATSGATAHLTRSGSSLALVATTRWAPRDAELLRTAPDALRLRLGERTFHEATRSGVSCESCHPGHGTDGAAHNIGGRVLAPTLDVRGLAGTAPFLRDGSYAHAGDLEEVARLEYRGYRAPLGDRRALLDAFVAALPLPTSLAPRELARERRGLDAFVRAGCPTCHAAPAFTTLARFPARTVFPELARTQPRTATLSLDVPSLRNLRGNAPYLFDGRARTLLDVLTTANPSDTHGQTRALTPAERDDLVFFLETL